MKQIEENENLVKQVDELQKEIEDLKKDEEKVTDETIDWKTYRNEEYGFEINYPTVGWEMEVGHYWGASPFDFKLYKISSEEKRYIYFYIHGTIWFMSPICKDFDWREIISNIFDYTEEQIYSMSLEREVTADSEIKGYQVKIRDARGEMRGVFFPFPGLKWNNEEVSRAFILFTYYLEPKPTLEEIEIFDQVAYSFRFIEK